MLQDPSVLTGIIVVLVGVAAGRYLFKKDTQIEDRRKRAIKVAGVFQAANVPHVPEFLTNYAVGDYSGMAKTLDKAYHLLDVDGAADKLVAELKGPPASA